MTKQEKIDFLMKRIGDRFTRKHLESKDDRFINALYLIECQQEDRELDSLLTEL